MTTDNRTETARLTWGDCPGVERDPERLAGAWTFGHTRLPLHVVFENLGGGVSIKEITGQFGVTEGQIRDVLAHATRCADHPRAQSHQQQPLRGLLICLSPGHQGGGTPRRQGVKEAAT